MVYHMSLPELLDFIPQEKRQIPRAATFPKPGNPLWISFAGKKVACVYIIITAHQNFLFGNLLKISLAFPLDLLAGKSKNTGSEG